MGGNASLSSPRDSFVVGEEEHNLEEEDGLVYNPDDQG